MQNRLFDLYENHQILSLETNPSIQFRIEKKSDATALYLFSTSKEKLLVPMPNLFEGHADYEIYDIHSTILKEYTEDHSHVTLKGRHKVNGNKTIELHVYLSKDTLKPKPYLLMLEGNQPAGEARYLSKKNGLIMELIQHEYALLEQIVKKDIDEQLQVVEKHDALSSELFELSNRTMALPDYNQFLTKLTTLIEICEQLLSFGIGVKKYEKLLNDYHKEQARYQALRDDCEASNSQSSLKETTIDSDSLPKPKHAKHKKKKKSSDRSSPVESKQVNDISAFIDKYLAQDTLHQQKIDAFKKAIFESNLDKIKELKQSLYLNAEEEKSITNYFLTQLLGDNNSQRDTLLAIDDFFSAELSTYKHHIIKHCLTMCPIPNTDISISYLVNGFILNKIVFCEIILRYTNFMKAKLIYNNVAYNSLQVLLMLVCSEMAFKEPADIEKMIELLLDKEEDFCPAYQIPKIIVKKGETGDLKTYVGPASVRQYFFSQQKKINDRLKNKSFNLGPWSKPERVQNIYRYCDAFNKAPQDRFGIRFLIDRLENLLYHQAHQSSPTDMVDTYKRILSKSTVLMRPLATRVSFEQLCYHFLYFLKLDHEYNLFNATPFALCNDDMLNDEVEITAVESLMTYEIYSISESAGRYGVFCPFINNISDVFMDNIIKKSAEQSPQKLRDLMRFFSRAVKVSCSSSENAADSLAKMRVAYLIYTCIRDKTIEDHRIMILYHLIYMQAAAWDDPRMTMGDGRIKIPEDIQDLLNLQTHLLESIAYYKNFIDKVEAYLPAELKDTPEYQAFLQMKAMVDQAIQGVSNKLEEDNVSSAFTSPSCYL